jgi:hypothetical protein
MKINKRIVISVMLLLLAVSGIAQSGGNDFTFNPGGFGPGEGANNGVYSTVVQTDGKILVGGWFTSFNGTSCNRITRLNADGSIDATFNPGSGPNEEMQLMTRIDDMLHSLGVENHGSLGRAAADASYKPGNFKMDETLNEGIKVKKEFITESIRMQKLAGLESSK